MEWGGCMINDEGSLVFLLIKKSYSRFQDNVKVLLMLIYAGSLDFNLSKYLYSDVFVCSSRLVGCLELLPRSNKFPGLNLNYTCRLDAAVGF